MSHLINCSSSYEVWQSLDALYSSSSQDNIIQHKMELNSLRKGGMTMAEYLLKVKNLINDLGYAVMLTTLEIIYCIFYLA